MMLHLRSAEQGASPALVRLQALSPLDGAALAALRQSLERPRTLRARWEYLAEGQEFPETLLILNGWAARQRILEDGRRQIIEFLLPGDLIGACNYDRPVSSTAVVTLTEVEVCVAPDAAVSPTLERVYALSRAIAEAHLAAHITRLGRMNAHDRIADLLLELLERLELAGLAAKGAFPLPLTQEILADSVGLTPVHVNRSLQALRREGALDLKSRELTLLNPQALRRSIGRSATRVTAA